MNAGMQCTVFLGPTLPHDKAMTLWRANYLPPAAMGDVCAVVAARPDVIVLVDGVFEDRPSVWHKELLWAIDQGIAVIGACSMGALRAAELHEHGMYGFGEVFDGFRTGSLTDDDEVAVSHAPAEMHWLPLTDAMVDIRDIVRRATENSLITQAEASAILTHAKQQHFKERSADASFTHVLSKRRSAVEVADIQIWLRNAGPSLKERDCRDLLSNLDSISKHAHLHRQDRRAFSTTVYMSRLEPFGFTTEQGGTSP